MAYNFIWDFYPSTKAKIIIVLATGGPITARQIYAKLRELGISNNGIYKALQEFVKSNVILKETTLYRVNPNTGSEYIELGRKIKGIMKSPDMVFVHKFENIITQLNDLRDSLGKL